MKQYIKNIGASLLRNLDNRSGWRTKRKIIVFESDDWGSIRLPSTDVYQKFAQRGFNVSQSRYNRYDALESNDDMLSLFEVLRKHRNKFGKAPCITANTIVANPDFTKIAHYDFMKYFYEPFTETLNQYPKHNQVFSLYKEGIQDEIFKPQFHGREHLQINRWIKALKAGEKDIRFTFSLGTTYSGKDDYNFMEAYDADSPDEFNLHREIIADGLSLFNSLFSYSSKSFIAPCYTWDEALESKLVEHGVKYMQGGMNQYIPQGGFENYKKRRHYLGEQSNAGLTYLTRNCFFEPSLVNKSDWVDYTLASVRDAFRWNKPAIICAHRINFIGYIDESNRMNNLKLFDDLLKSIIAKWPDVEFMSSDQLGDLIRTPDTISNSIKI